MAALWLPADHMTILSGIGFESGHVLGSKLYLLVIACQKYGPISF